MHRRPAIRPVLAAAAILALAPAAGCPDAHRSREPRVFGDEITGPLTPARLREVYGTPAFVIRASAPDGTRRARQDTDLPPDAPVPDENLVVLVEGAGDSVDAFRHTAALLAESPYDFPDRPGPLLVALLRWNESSRLMREHLNREGQQYGAARLADLLEVHRLRHGPRGRASLVGFSAGTRVIEMAYRGEVYRGQDTHPEALVAVRHVVYLGSSVSCTDPTPYESIRGRFVNFVNPRDTHFADRATYAAPAGGRVRPLKLLVGHTLRRQPHFGAGRVGFQHLPTFTRPEQFEAVARAAAAEGTGLFDQAFRMVNVPVPEALMARGLLGQALEDDDLDDFLNFAPNHYILMGRGPGGATDGAVFGRYRAIAEGFVREQVAAAALAGRVFSFDVASEGEAAPAATEKTDGKAAREKAEPAKAAKAKTKG